MTVAELIEKLRQYPAEYAVLVGSKHVVDHVASIEVWSKAQPPAVVLSNDDAA